LNPFHHGRRPLPMNIQDNNSVDNPSKVENHSDRQTTQQIVDGLKQLADGLLASVPEAVERGESFDQVERFAWRTAIQLGAQTMELFLSLQGDGDLGQPLSLTKTRHYIAQRQSRRHQFDRSLASTRLNNTPIALEQTKRSNCDQSAFGWSCRSIVGRS
jgi:hypothetical protein